MGLKTSLAAALRGVGKSGFIRPLWGQTVLEQQQAVVAPSYAMSAGERPRIAFSTLRDAYLKFPDAYAAVNFIANRVLSRGFYISTSKEGDPDGRAEELLETWNLDVVWGDKRGERGLLGLLRIVVRELLWGGTSFIEIIEPERLERLAQVQLTSIDRLERDDEGNLKAIFQVPHINSKPLDPERFVVVQWNVVDRSPFGYGLLHSLAESKMDLYGKVVPSYFDSMAQLQRDSVRGLHRYGVPRAIYGFRGLGEEKLKPYAEILKDPDTDASFVTNVEVEVKSDSPASAPRFDPLFEFFETRFQAGIQTPIIKLLTSTGFTEASAKVAAELADIQIWDMQQMLAHSIEHEFYSRVLDQSGFDSTRIKPRLIWGSADVPQYSIADLFRGVELGVVNLREVRRILRERIGWDLEQEAPQTGGSAAGEVPA